MDAIKTLNSCGKKLHYFDTLISLWRDTFQYRYASGIQRNQKVSIFPDFHLKIAGV